MDFLKQAALKIIENEVEKISPVSLENRLIGLFNSSRRNVRKAVKELLNEGELVYTYHFGSSFLEKSFNRPVRVSDKVVLKPAGMSFDAAKKDVVICLDHGVSFGTGQHPTTRLAIRAIEALSTITSFFSPKQNSLLLDIGTGSGVLALTALKFGICRALATDIDPCARDEAVKNACLNGLDSRFEIYEGSIADLEPPVDLVCANLRFPTLMNLSGEIVRLCGPDGCVVFSGVREDEFFELSTTYAGLGFKCCWQSVDHKWAGGLFVRCKYL